MQTKKKKTRRYIMQTTSLGARISWVGGQDSVIFLPKSLFVCLFNFQTNRVNLKCPNSSRKIHWSMRKSDWGVCGEGTMNNVERKWGYKQETSTKQLLRSMMETVKKKRNKQFFESFLSLGVCETSFRFRLGHATLTSSSPFKRPRCKSQGRRWRFCFV